MSFKSPTIRTVFFIFLFLFGSVSSFAQSARADFQALKNLLVQNHVEPRELNNQFATDACEMLLKLSDPDKLYFTDSERMKVVAHQSQIVTDLNKNEWTFFPLFFQLYKIALDRATLNVQALSGLTIDPNEKGFYQADSTWAADEAALKKKFQLKAKVRFLEQLYFNRSDENENIKTKKALELVQKNMKRSVDKALHASQGFENYAAKLMIQSLSLSFDPHSYYLSSAEMQNFVESLSSQGFHFGFHLTEDMKGSVVVQGIVPGGPAWKSGEIFTGDVIEGLAWQGKEKVDALMLSREEVESILMESNHDLLELYLRSATGESKKVLLKKELQTNDDNLVRSAIFNSTHKIGYISLPDFYSNWGQAGGANCANDVAKEILKLKKAGIKGLMLDLRFNGGGSLMEAVAMAGIFIDAGPMGLMREKSGEVVTYKDFNRGTVWDGPLMVLVNGYSASASEFVAAALQDYNRALIVGSRTFGKGTSQNMFSLQPGKSAINFAEVGKNKNGYATVTTGKTYRITGKTVQYRGVMPDINIPDIYNFRIEREGRLPNALKSDEVFKKVYYQPLPSLVYGKISNASNDRVAQSPYFKLVNDLSNHFSDISRERKPIPLNKNDFQVRYAKLSELLDSYRELSERELEHFTIEFLSGDAQRMEMDEYVRDLHTTWTKSLKHDNGVGEAINIMNDFIDTNKTP